MLRMMKCPHCGASNSEKRTSCFHCQGQLHLPPAPTAPPVVVPHAAVPPSPPRAAPGDRRRARDEERARRPPSSPWTEEAGILEGLIFPNASRRARLFRQMESQLRAGITVGDAFRFLSEEGVGRYRGQCAAIAAELFRGGSLVEAVQPYHELFAQEDLGLLRVGELSGNLPEVFAQMAQRLEQLIELRWGFVISHWHFAVFYFPGLLVFLPFALTINDPAIFNAELLMSRNPIENVRILAEETARRSLTTSVPILGAVVAVLVLWRLPGRTRGGQQVQHRLLLAVPFIGGVFKRAAVGRFIGNLSALWGGGAPPSVAVEAAAESSGNQVLLERVRRLIPDLQAGVPLAQALSSTGLLDRETLGLIRTGELTGDLPGTLDRLARDLHLNTRLGLRRLPLVSYLIFFALFAVILFKVMLTMYMAYYGGLIGQMADPEFLF